MEKKQLFFISVFFSLNIVLKVIQYPRVFAITWSLSRSTPRGWSQFQSAAGTTTSSSRRTPTWMVLSADTRSRRSSCSLASPRTSWPIYGRRSASLRHMTVTRVCRDRNSRKEKDADFNIYLC